MSHQSRPSPFAKPHAQKLSTCQKARCQDEEKNFQLIVKETFLEYVPDRSAIQDLRVYRNIYRCFAVPCSIALDFDRIFDLAEPL